MPDTSEQRREYSNSRIIYDALARLGPQTQSRLSARVDVTAVVQIKGREESRLVDRLLQDAERTAFQTAGAAVSLRGSLVRSN